MAKDAQGRSLVCAKSKGGRLTWRVGKNPLLHMRVKSAWPPTLLGVSTTNDGRSSLSLPRP